MHSAVFARGLVVAIGAALPSLAHTAEPIRRGQQFVVNTYRFDVQRRPDVAAAGDGSFVVVWQSFYGASSDSSFDLFGQRYDAAGQRHGGEFKVNTGIPSPDYYAQDRPSVAAASDGSFVVVWDSGGYVDGADAYGIVGKRYDAGGAAQGAEFVVNDPHRDGYQYLPAVAAAPDGRFVVAWGSYGAADDGDDAAVVARRYDSAGIPQATDFVVNTYTTGNQHYPAVGIAPDASFVVVWEDNRRNAVVGRRYSSAGAPQGGEFIVSTTPASYADVNVGVRPDGGFVVVWRASDGSNDGILARRYDSAGAAVGGQFVVNSLTTGYQGRPDVAVNPDGSFVVGWLGDSGSSRKPFVRRFDSAGVPEAADFQVSQRGAATTYRRALSVAGAPDETFVVVWRSDVDPDDPEAETDIIGQRFGAGVVGCTAAPHPDCREPVVERRGIFRFSDVADDTRDALVWHAPRLESTTPLEVGDPLTGTAYALCVYDASGSPQPLVAIASPAGGPCRFRPCWKPVSGGAGAVEYIDRARESDGLERIRLKPGDGGRTRLVLRAAGENLTLPATPLTPPVRVQLQASNGTCWGATYQSFVSRNAGGQFKAKPDAGS